LALGNSLKFNACWANVYSLAVGNSLNGMRIQYKDIVIFSS